MCNKHIWWKESEPCKSHLDVIGFAPSLHAHQSHGWHGCGGINVAFSTLVFTMHSTTLFFINPHFFILAMWVCSVLQPLLWIFALTNQSTNLKTFLSPRTTNISMPHGKIQWMLVCFGLNATFVKTPSSTNLCQHAQCSHSCSSTLISMCMNNLECAQHGRTTIMDWELSQIY